ncbi:hypothetical protein ACGO3R_05275 [Lactococcus lactis]
MLAGDYSSLNGTWQTTDGCGKAVLKMVPSFLVQNIKELYLDHNQRMGLLWPVL